LPVVVDVGLSFVVLNRGMVHENEKIVVCQRLHELFSMTRCGGGCVMLFFEYFFFFFFFFFSRVHALSWRLLRLFACVLIIQVCGEHVGSL
jgi:hypothetical protein